jgi:hypothetical protein
MKRNLLFGALVLLSGSLFAADSNPKDDIVAASKKLADKPNYSWTTTFVVPESSQWKPGPSIGQTEKGGFTHVTISFNDNTNHIVLKGDKAAGTVPPDGEWMSLAEMEKSEGPGRFFAMLLRNTKTPDVQVADLAAGAKELKKDGDSLAGDLTEEAVKKLLTFRIGNEGPTVTNPSGSVKVWLKEGLVSKFEFKVKGLVKFNEIEMDIDRATIIEIKEIGTTKLNVPEEARKKLL